MDETATCNPRVLIVEDDVIIARDLENALQRRGYPVVAVVRTAEEAERAAGERRPDVALVDVELRGGHDADGEGVALARLLKESHGIPSIFLTGYSREAVVREMRELAPAGYVRKPFSEGEIFACLDGLGSGGERPESSLSPGPAPGSEPASSAAPPQQADWAGQQPEPEVPAARASALRKVADIARDPAFRELIGKSTDAGSPGDTGSGDREEIARDHTESGEQREGQSPGVDAPASDSESDSLGLAADLGEPVLIYASDGKILAANARAQNCFAAGEGKEELAERSLEEIFPGEEFGEAEENFLRVASRGDGEALQEEHRFEFHDTSRKRWHEVRTRACNDGVVALFLDISEAKADEVERIRQQRLEGLGLLARGFAHDFNNHLTALAGNLGLAKERHPEDGELQGLLTGAQEATARAAGTVQQLLTFARGGRPIREEIALPGLIRQALDRRRETKPEIRYQFDPGEDELRVRVDPAQTGRLLENLVENAEEAMRGGGVLLVRCRRIGPGEAGELRESPRPLEREHFLVEIVDNGRGMPREVLDRAFEPYFTTRKAENATGIGLTVCESIAKAHGGFIHLQSREGKGTIASFCAPMVPDDGEEGTDREAEDAEKDEEISPGTPTSADDKAPGALASPPATADDKPLGAPSPGLAPADDRELEGDGEKEQEQEQEKNKAGADSDEIPARSRILLLEDEESILRLMSATLEREGYEVVETRDGVETVAVYEEAREKGHPFDLVICDLTIEDGQGGVETMRRLAEIDPAVLSIVSSGYSDAPAMADPRGHGFRGVLPKPYAPSQLVEVVGRVLRLGRAG